VLFLPAGKPEKEKSEDHRSDYGGGYQEFERYPRVTQGIESREHNGVPEDFSFIIPK
jgi:hypothetical protein